jgi:hypothetical protein
MMFSAVRKVRLDASMSNIVSICDETGQALLLLESVPLQASPLYCRVLIRGYLAIMS